jgi:hypothetical protein
VTEGIEATEAIVEIAPIEAATVAEEVADDPARPNIAIGRAVRTAMPMPTLPAEVTETASVRTATLQAATVVGPSGGSGSGTATAVQAEADATTMMEVAAETGPIAT